MVESFVAIIDRLIQLKQHRDENLQRIFEKLIEPTFNETLLIHKNYVEMFEEVLAIMGIEEGKDDHLRSGEVSQTQAIAAAQRLRERRIEFEPVRRKLASLATEMDGAHMTHALSMFVTAFQTYFPTGKAVGAGTESRMLLQGLDHWINNSPDPEPAGDWLNGSRPAASAVVSSVRLTLNRLRTRWALLCEAYATLKIHVYTHK